MLVFHSVLIFRISSSFQRHFNSYFRLFHDITRILFQQNNFSPTLVAKILSQLHFSHTIAGNTLTYPWLNLSDIWASWRQFGGRKRREKDFHTQKARILSWIRWDMRTNFSSLVADITLKDLHRGTRLIHPILVATESVEGNLHLPGYHYLEVDMGVSTRNMKLCSRCSVVLSRAIVC